MDQLIDSIYSFKPRADADFFTLCTRFCRAVSGYTLSRVQEKLLEAGWKSAYDLAGEFDAKDFVLQRRESRTRELRGFDYVLDTRCDGSGAQWILADVRGFLLRFAAFVYLSLPDHADLVRWSTPYAHRHQSRAAPHNSFHIRCIPSKERTYVGINLCLIIQND